LVCRARTNFSWLLGDKMEIWGAFNTDKLASAKVQWQDNRATFFLFQILIVQRVCLSLIYGHISRGSDSHSLSYIVGELGSKI
jgi:hypothetical protein